ncbi:24418_t:CDS:2, partial [Racocetra persica]
SEAKIYLNADKYRKETLESEVKTYLKIHTINAERNMEEA